jgi:hypothetical protein
LKRLDPIARNSFAGGLVAKSVEIFKKSPYRSIG